MILYRGQAVQPTIGLWWTSSDIDARSFAQARGGRAWLVLSIEVDDEWAVQFLRFSNVSGSNADWYQIPRTALLEQWRAVQIHSGQLAV